MALTSSRRLEFKVRMSGAMPLLPHTPSWRGQGQLDLYLLRVNVKNEINIQ